MLVVKDAPRENVVVRGARVLDPAAGVDATLDVRVDEGVIVALGTDLDTNAHRVLDAEGLVLAPAFVDPHVHLRTPGREDEEDIGSGTRAAAAGGFCAILAMPNTDPVVDSAPVLRSLRERAHEEARVPVGFLAAITRGQAGEQLTEMGELADEGAVGFSDDGLRQALSYQKLAGLVLALHEEDPSLSGLGAMHEGAVSAQLGLAGIPSVSESTMIARDAALARYEDARLHV